MKFFSFRAHFTFISVSQNDFVNNLFIHFLDFTQLFDHNEESLSMRYQLYTKTSLVWNKPKLLLSYVAQLDEYFLTCISYPLIDCLQFDVNKWISALTWLLKSKNKLRSCLFTSEFSRRAEKPVRHCSSRWSLFLTNEWTFNMLLIRRLMNAFSKTSYHYYRDVLSSSWTHLADIARLL